MHVLDHHLQLRSGWEVAPVIATLATRLRQWAFSDEPPDAPLTLAGLALGALGLELRHEPAATTFAAAVWLVTARLLVLPGSHRRGAVRLLLSMRPRCGNPPGWSQHSARVPPDRPGSSGCHRSRHQRLCTRAEHPVQRVVTRRARETAQHISTRQTARYNYAYTLQHGLVVNYTDFDDLAFHFDGFAEPDL
jgi:hypothetical protein